MKNLMLVIGLSCATAVYANESCCANSAKESCSSACALETKKAPVAPAAVVASNSSVSQVPTAPTAELDVDAVAQEDLDRLCEALNEIAAEVPAQESAKVASN